MDEDFETEEQSAELPAEAMDLQALVAANPALAAYMQKYEADIAAADAARQKQAKIKKDIFEKGEKEILARRYGAPTTSEQLFALSAALLAPRRYTGFAGTLDKIAPVLGQMDKLQSSAEAQRNEARDRLRREYLTGVADADVAAAQARVEARGRLLSPLVSATKPSSQAAYTYMPDRGGYGPKPGVGGNPPFPSMDAYGNYVVEDQRQIVYLPPNSPIVLPGGDPMQPRYTPAIASR